MRLVFANRCTRVVDLGPLLQGPIVEPMARSLEEFRKVRADPELGTIAWPNGADICPDVLRYGLQPAWMDDSAEADLR